MKALQRTKAGKGFYQSGYGRGFAKETIIYIINNKYYAKSSYNAKTAYDGDLLNEGYVCVNKDTDGVFYQCSLSEHKTIN